MIIHIVQDGDTIESISNMYNIPKSRIESDNNLSSNYTLNTGRAIMIVPPAETYVVKDGDTLSNIAESYGVSLLQLLRNNPQLSDRNFLNIGEELVIRYTVDKKINVFGYSTIYISDSVLIKTLPYLTYLTIFSYKIDAKGTFPDLDDTRIINLALEYGVAPIMTVNSMTETGLGNPGTTHAIMTSLEAQNQFIENALANMKV